MPEDEFLTLAELANKLRVSYHTIYRAYTDGKESLFTGKLCLLKVRQRFGRLYTTMAWYEDFENELNKEG